MWPVKRRVADFFIRYQIWQMEKISETIEAEDDRQTHNRAKKSRRTDSFKRRIDKL